MFDEQDRKWLYEQMQSAGVNTGDYDNFKADLNDKTVRDWYYDKSQELGLDVGTPDEFVSLMVEPQPDALDLIEDKIAKERGTQPSAAVSAVKGGYAGMIQRAAERQQQQPGPVQPSKATAEQPVKARGSEYINNQGKRFNPTTRMWEKDPVQEKAAQEAQERERREAKAGTLPETHYPLALQGKTYTPSEKTQESMTRDRQMWSRMQTAYLTRREQSESAMEQAFADAEDIRDSETIAANAWSNMGEQERESMIADMVAAIKETNPLEEGMAWDEAKLREYGEAMAKEEIARWMVNYASKSPTYINKKVKQDKEVTRLQSSEMQREVRERLKQRGMELDEEALEFSWRDRPRGSGGAVHTFNSATINGRYTDSKWKTLNAAKDALDNAERLFREAEINKQGGIHGTAVAQLARGMDKVGDPRLWDMGLSAGINADALRSALTKADKGKQLTEEETMLLDAKAIELAAQMYTESDISGWFKAGEVTADALPFMLEMMINPASKIGSSTQAMLTRYALKRWSKQALKKGGGAVWRGRMLRYGGRALSDVGAATYMAATTGSMRSLANATERLNGDIQTSTDAEGKTHYAGHNVDPDMTDWKAFWQGFGSTAIESHSEMLGEYFAPLMSIAGKGLGKFADSRFGKALSLDNVMDFFDNVKLSDRYKLWSDFMEKTKWSGTIGEYAEEVVGGIENAIIVGDQELSTDPEKGVFNLEQNLETLRGVAVMGVGMSTMRTFGYRTPKQKARKALRLADNEGRQLFGDRWGDLKSLIADNLDSEELPKQMAQQMMDMSAREKRAMLDYYTASYQYKGADYGDEQEILDYSVAARERKDAEENYESGFGITDEAEQQQAWKDYKSAHADLKEIMSEEEITVMYEWLNDEQAEGENPVLSGREWSVRDRAILNNYVNAKAVVDGIKDRAEEEADEVIAGRRYEDMKMRQRDGSIHPATLKGKADDGTDGVPVYIIDGNVAQMEDGSIDGEKSDQTIVIYNPATGEKRMDVTPGDFSELGQVQSADDYEAELQQQKADYMKAEMDRMLYTVRLGDELDMPDGNKGVVIAINPDGSAVVQEGEEFANMGMDELQEIKDQNENEARQQPRAAVGEGEQTEENTEAKESQMENQGAPEEFEPMTVLTVQDEEGNRQEMVVSSDKRFTMDAYGNVAEDPNGSFIGLYDLVEGEARYIREDLLRNMTVGYEMLDSQNGDAAQPVGEEAQEEEEPPAKPVIGQRMMPAIPEAPEPEPEPVDPMSQPMPTHRVEIKYRDENGKTVTEEVDEPDFMAVPVERTHHYIYNEKGYPREKADQFVENNLRGAQERANKLRATEPKMGSSMTLYDRQHGVWENQMAAAQQEVDYWNKVKEEQLKVVVAEREAAQAKEQERQRAAKEQIKAMEQREREAREAEKAKAKAEQERKNKQAEAILEHAQQMSEERGEDEIDWPIEEDADAMEALNDTEPRTIEEVAAQLLAKRKTRVDPESYRAHTGYSTTEQRTLPFVFARPENGGVSLEELGEMVQEAARDANVKFDELDANAGLNALLTVMGEANGLNDLTNYIQNARRAEAEEIHSENLLRAAAARAEESWIMQHGGMSRDEFGNYIAWMEDAVEQGKTAITDEEFNQIFNDNENQNENDTGTATTDEGSIERGAEESGTDGTEAEQAGASEDDTRGDGEENGTETSGADDGRGSNGISDQRRTGEEIDENGHPFVKTADGSTTFGEIREESGLPAAPIKLSEGYQDENGKGYGLAHIEANHGDQIREAGFNSVEDFVSYVAQNYDEDNIRVGKRRVNGSTSYLIQVTDEYDNTLFIELSRDGSYWNVNSGGIFRKGYSNKKETVAKTEPQQPDNAVSGGSSLSEEEGDGITSTEPNGEPSVSSGKDTNISENGKKNVTSATKTAENKKRKTASPVLKSYNDLKNKYPNHTILYRVGDYYYVYGEDAKKVSEVLGTPLQKENGVDMTAVSHYEGKPFLPKLKKAGMKVLLADNISEQYEEANKPKADYRQQAEKTIADILDGVERGGNGPVVSDEMTEAIQRIADMEADAEERLEAGVDNADEKARLEAQRDTAEKWLDDNVRSHKTGGETSKTSKRDKAILGALVEKLRSFLGKERVITRLSEAQKALIDWANAKKSTTAAVFYSNAERAVEGIKQEKATAEQWLAMIQKAGGLKAGEDKWLGLSDWLTENKGKSLTKQQVLDYIRENQIKVEEVEYGKALFSPNSKINLESELKKGKEEGKSVSDVLEAWDKEFGDTKLDDWFAGRFVVDNNGDIETVEESRRPINRIRLGYTTPGLQNNREIALVVPNIESWHTGDEVHFGDAGEGRAVAWVRFGETTVPNEAAQQAFKEAQEAWDDFGNRMYDKYGANYREKLTPEEQAENQTLLERYNDTKTIRNDRVLVIDEIQSKRHQEGREKGYGAPKEQLDKLRSRYEAKMKELEDYRKELEGKYGDEVLIGMDGKVTAEEYAKYQKLHNEANEAQGKLQDQYINYSNHPDAIPDAPFEKNWHEVAMKRMLRYAAENGFDKVAWTTGEQQAERYNIGNVISSITVEPLSYKDEDLGVEYAKEILVRGKDGNNFTLKVTKDGVIRGGDYYNRESLQNVFGKELAARIMSTDGKTTIENDGLRIGGEGMKGFYDQILPRFMDKYGKKWGVKTTDIELPNIGDNGLAMHSVDVTPDMKQSVMEGQPIFHKVFHGSGADFDAFDHSHMGEGEGAQAYGWGTYVTEVKGIGKAYAEANNKGGFNVIENGINKVKRNHYELSDIERKVLGDIGYDYFGKDADKHLKSIEKKYKDNIAQLEKNAQILREDIKNTDNTEEKETYATIIKQYEEEIQQEKDKIQAYDWISKEIRAGLDRILYTVDIPDDNGSNYLEWDEPIKQKQLSKIASLLAKEKGKEYGDYIRSKKGSYGENIYYELYTTFGSQEAASKFLSRAGFTGIKYPAQYRSGGREDGAKNYVIFDESDLKITDKMKFFRTPDGEVYGFALDGKIYIDTEIAKADTPIHEFTHLWASMIRENDPEQWEDIKKLLQDKDVRPFMEIVRKRYPELTKEGREDDFMEEVLAHFSGAKGLERLEEAAREYEEQDGGGYISKAKAVTALNKVKEALEKFWGKVAQLFGRHPKSAADVADMILSDLLQGVDPTEAMNVNSESNDIRFQKGGRTDREGNPIGDGSHYTKHKVETFDEYPQIKSSVQKSATTESVYVTYHNTDNGKTIRVRFSNHVNNATKFGDELDGAIATKDEILYHLGLRDREFIPMTEAVIPSRQVSKKDLQNKTYPESDLTIQEMYKKVQDGESIANEVGKVAKGSNYLIVGDGSIQEVTRKNAFGETVRVGDYRYSKPIEPQPIGKDDGDRLRSLDPESDEVRTREAESRYELNPYAPYGSYEESLEAAKAAGYTKRQHDAMVERRKKRYAERGERAKEFAEKLNLGGRVEILDNAEGLEERFQGKKGWYDPRAGKITVVLDKHGSMDDILQTILHEGVGHHGLRELFGKEFDNFLDNVYAGAESDVRQRIIELTKKHGWNVRTATEEYLSQMAETMDINNPETMGFWEKVKELFWQMLHKLGIKDAFKGTEAISDNELRYILWRSYQNLVNPGRYRSFVEEAIDVAKQRELKVGEYAEAKASSTGRRKWEETKAAEAKEKLKKEYPDAVILSKVNNGYKATGEDAERLSRVVGKELSEDGSLRLTNDEMNDALFKLVSAGQMVITTEDLENKAAEGDGIVFRDADENENADESQKPKRTPNETEQIWKDGSVGMQERMAAAAAALAEKHSKDARLRDIARRAIGGDLASIRKAMSVQKSYDRATVKRVSDLARVLLQTGYMDELSSGEVKRLLSAVKNATGRNEIESSARKVMDIMIDNQLKRAEERLHELESVRGSKVDANKGVEVQGSLDVAGQEIMKAFKRWRKKGTETIQRLMDEAQERMGSDNEAIAEAAANEYAGLQLALEYAENLKQSEYAEEKLKKYKEDAKPAYDNGGFANLKAYKEYLASCDEMIRQNRVERLNAYNELIAKLGGSMMKSVESAQAFKEREKERIREIHQDANSDMEGRPANEHYVPKFKDKFVNNSFISFLFSPLISFEQMLRMFGSKSANGEGYLFNRFMRGWVDAREKEISGVRSKYKALDNKVEEIFDGEVKSMAQLIRKERNMPKMAVIFMDGGQPQPHELTQGNLMYIYMVNKMTDGRMKLRKMGIDEEAVQKITDALDPRLKQLADWMQEEFLVETRNEYNETHKRMFGAPMASIENYFPLKINQNARTQREEELDQQDWGEGITTATGAIKKRTVNNTALDLLNADALNVMLNHVAEMEHWNAFAEYNRDLNTLRTYKRFRNQVKNMTTIYGSGDELWQKFNDVAQMASGSYRPKRANLDAAAVNFAKGVTAAKVSFHIFTALKQYLSMPAYAPDVRPDIWMKNMATPWEAWNWTIENLPVLEERWKRRIAGDPRLLKSELDWKGWRNNVVQMASRVGMSPNAFVDFVTVSVGAKTIYETKKARYLKEGYSEEQADKKAKQDATILPNETQQSSEGAFLSPMQVDRSWLSVMFTVFRNSPMSYQRQLHDALRNLKRDMKKGNKAESVEFMAKQMEREGVDADKAQKAAEKRYNRQVSKDVLRVATFGYILQLAWNLGAKLPYLLFGDDDDKKKEMIDDVWAQSMFGWGEGLTGGDVFSQAGKMAVQGKGNPEYLTKEMPIASDIKDVLQEIGNGKYGEVVNDMVNLAVQIGIGVNPQSITDAVLAVMDACSDDPALAHEAMIAVMRILQVPQSQIKKLYFDEIGMTGEEASHYTPEQLIERYARYQVKRGRLIEPWTWADEEALDKQRKQGEEAVKERVEKIGGEVNEAYERLTESMQEWREKEKALNKAQKESYVEAAKVMAEIQKDPEGWQRYLRFKMQDKQLDAAVKAYMGSATAEEAQANKEKIEDLKKQMVEELQQ